MEIAFILLISWPFILDLDLDVVAYHYSGSKYFWTKAR